MSKVLVARYCPTEDLFLIPPDWDMAEIYVRRHNIYYKGKM